VVDEKDIGIRPGHEALLGLADRLDREKAEILKAHEPDLAAAGNALKAGEHELAAQLYDLVAQSFRDVHFAGDADAWTQRAKDCRDVVRQRAKLKRKGRVRR
jgi:hypothetical protein